MSAARSLDRGGFAEIDELTWHQALIGDTVVRYELESDGGETVLRFIHSGLKISDAKGYLPGEHAHLDRMAPPCGVAAAALVGRPRGGGAALPRRGLNEAPRRRACESRRRERAMDSSMDLAVHETRIHRVRDGKSGDVAIDRVVVEAPLEIRIGGVPTTVVMRTPGEDEELVMGFLFTEGLIVRDADVVGMRRPDGLGADEIGNVLDVELAPRVVQIRTPQRSFYASSSCGVCGKSSIKALEVKAPAIQSALTIRRSTLASLPKRLSEAQAVFEQTGGLHAAGFFRPDGELVVLREDVGRHNAVDKIAGYSLGRAAIPMSDGVLVVSGRLGFEIVQKAVMCAIPIIAAVSAPSSSALALAERFGVTVAGFVRGNSMNLYTRPERVLLEE